MEAAHQKTFINIQNQD